MFAEIANHAAALLGPQLAEQDRVDSLRVGIGDIIARRSFLPVAQAVVDLATSRVVGYEVLTRFSDGARLPGAILVS